MSDTAYLVITLLLFSFLTGILFKVSAISNRAGRVVEILEVQTKYMQQYQQGEW